MILYKQPLAAFIKKETKQKEPAVPPVLKVHRLDLHVLQQNPPSLLPPSPIVSKHGLLAVKTAQDCCGPRAFALDGSLCLSCWLFLYWLTLPPAVRQMSHSQGSLSFAGLSPAWLSA